MKRNQNRLTAYLQARARLRRVEARNADMVRKRKRALGQVVVCGDGDYIEVVQRKPLLSRPPVSSRRGIISGFSRRSRSRLWSLLMRLDRRYLPLFVTLTFHNAWPGDVAVLKRMLDTFFKRMRRRYPQASAIWKLEYQRRGAPHFHLLLWGFPCADRDWIADTWVAVVRHYVRDESGYILDWHLGRLGNGNQHCVQKVRSWRGVRAYAAKYLSKTEVVADSNGEVVHTGRMWGVHNRNYIPWYYVIFAVAGLSLRRWRRVVRALLSRRGLSLPWLFRDKGFKVWNLGVDALRALDYKYEVDFRLDNRFLEVYNEAA